MAELLREYGYDKATEIVDSIRTAVGNPRLGENQPADDDTASGTPAADGDTSLLRKRLGRVGDAGETPSLFDDAENQDVAKSAAFDKDKLEAQRLTAAPARAEDKQLADAPQPSNIRGRPQADELHAY